MNNWIDLGVVLSWTTLAVCGTLGSALITPRRTYYPVLRVQLAFLAFTGAYYGALRALEDTYHLMASYPWTRILGLLVMALAVMWALLFVVRRNRHPQYLVLDMRGAEIGNRLERVEQLLPDVLSAIRHDLVNEDAVKELSVALGERRRKQRRERDA